MSFRGLDLKALAGVALNFFFFYSRSVTFSRFHVRGICCLVRTCATRGSHCPCQGPYDFWRANAFSPFRWGLSFSCPDAMNPTRTTANNLAPIFIFSSSLMKQTLTRTHITYQQINHVMEFKEKCAILKQSKKNFKKRLKCLGAEERNDRGSRFSVRCQLVSGVP